MCKHIYAVFQMTKNTPPTYNQLQMTSNPIRTKIQLMKLKILNLECQIIKKLLKIGSKETFFGYK